MPRRALFHLAFGFSVIVFASMVGVFAVDDLNHHYLYGQGMLPWKMLLQQSAHGHSNMVGILHIIYGLSLSALDLEQRKIVWPSYGFIAGSLAMGPGLWARGYVGPTTDVDLLGVVVGVAAGFFFIALLWHCAMLWQRTLR